jgi:hypothetical protein
MVAEAQSKLGLMYVEGEGVPQDHFGTHVVAASKGSYGKAEALSRDRLAEKMTPEQIAEAQQLAREWQAKHQ